MAAVVAVGVGCGPVDGAGAPGVDDHSTGSVSLGLADDPAGMVTTCSGATCDTYYARSLVEHLWDKPKQAIKYAAEPLGSCFPDGEKTVTTGLSVASLLLLPWQTTALCVAVAGKAGQLFLDAVKVGAQTGQCVHMQYVRGLDAAGALRIYNVSTANGAACDQAERMWQQAHTPPAPYITDSGLRGWFNPITPTRFLDSRNTYKMSAGETRQVKVRGSGTPIPFSAVAVQLNVTATEPVGAGFLTVWQCDRTRPTASNVNFSAGQTIANSAISAVGSGDTVCVYSNVSTHVVVDASGYFDGSGGGFVPMTPFRPYDTRSLGLPSGITDDTVQMSWLPAAATAVALNVTATQPVGPGYLSVYPAFTAWPGTSTSNFVGGQTIAAATNVGVKYKAVALKANTPVHVIVDVFGYYLSGGGSKFAPVVPARLLDTRAWQYPTPLLKGTIVLIPTRLSGTPAGRTTAVALNVTAVAPRGPGYLTVYPCDKTGGKPVVSSVNFAGGETAIANSATVAVDGSDESICVYASETTDVVVDVSGYFQN